MLTLQLLALLRHPCSTSAPPVQPSLRQYERVRVAHHSPCVRKCTSTTPATQHNQHGTSEASQTNALAFVVALF